MKIISGLTEGKKLLSLDGLRAISIIFVLIAHFYIGNYYIDNSHIGVIGVHIFFVISGFLITTLLLKEKLNLGTINLKKFYIRRFFRIIPVVYLFILVLFILNYFFNLNIIDNSFYTSLSFTKNYPISNRGDDWWSSHLWSLSVEEQFYIIFSFFISSLSIKSYKKLVLLLIPVITIAQFIIQNSEYVGILYTNRILHILINVISIIFNDGIKVILIGSYLACIYFESSSSRFFNFDYINKNKFSTLILFTLAIIFGISTYHFFKVPYLPDIIFSFIIGYVIILNLNDNNIFSKFLNNKVIFKIGVLSFSLYIWQQLFTHKQPWKDTFLYGDSKFFNLISLLMVSLISYYFYEIKFLKIRDKFKAI